MPRTRSIGTRESLRTPAHALRRAWSEFLGRLQWQQSVTLTFDPKRVFPVSRERAEREASWWCAQLARVARRAVGWLFAAERTANGLWHVHVLVIGAGRLPWKLMNDLWRTRNGHAKIVPVHDTSGAVLYTTKEAYRTGEIVLSDTLTRYRNQLATNELVKLVPDDTEGDV